MASDLATHPQGPARLRVFATGSELVRAAAETLARVTSRDAPARRVSVALAGGSTPRALHELLANEYRHRIDWRRVELFFGDERAVAPEHPDSNFRMARETLLDALPIPPAGVWRMRAEEPDLDAECARYEREIRDRVPARARGLLPAFDLVWLGMGDDGHTASLFPQSSMLAVEDRLVAHGRVEKLGAERMTLTFPLLCAARRVQFLVRGAAKAPVLAEVLAQLAAGPERVPLSARHPSARVLPGSGELEWLVDADAAPDAPES